MRTHKNPEEHENVDRNAKPPQIKILKSGLLNKERNRLILTQSLKQNRQSKFKLQKAIQLLLAKYEELQEIRRLKMGIYSMSPRSFYGINKKLTFVQEICRNYMY